MEEGAGAFRKVGEAAESGHGAGAIGVFGSGALRRTREITPMVSRTSGHAGGTPEAEDPPGQEPVLLSQEPGARCIGEGSEAGDCGDVRSTRKVLCGTEISKVSRIAMVSWSFRERELGTGWSTFPLREGESPRHGPGPGHPESDWSQRSEVLGVSVALSSLERVKRFAKTGA